MSDDSKRRERECGRGRIWRRLFVKRASRVAQQKKSHCNAGDTRDSGSVLGCGRSSAGGHGNPHQCSSVENPTDRCMHLIKKKKKTDEKCQIYRFESPSQSQVVKEKEMATHSSVLAWRIPGTEEPGGLPSIGSLRVRHNWSDLAGGEREKKPTSFIIKYKILKSARGEKKIPLGRGPDGFIRELVLSNTQRTCMHACILSHFSRVWLLATPWTEAYQAPLSMRFSRQEY